MTGSLKNRFCTCLPVDPVPVAPGVSGDAALGLGRQPCTARAPPERPRPSLGTTSNSRPHVASRWGMLLGKSPSFPPETQGGCKRGLSVHPRGCGSGLSHLALRCGPHTGGCRLPDGLGSLLRCSRGPSPWVTRTCTDENLR